MQAAHDTNHRLFPYDLLVKIVAASTIMTLTERFCHWRCTGRLAGHLIIENHSYRGNRGTAGWICYWSGSLYCTAIHFDWRNSLTCCQGPRGQADSPTWHCPCSGCHVARRTASCWAPLDQCCGRYTEPACSLLMFLPCHCIWRTKHLSLAIIVFLH